MGFHDGSAQARNIRDPGQPTAHEYQERMTTHRPYSSWCKFCLMGCGVNSLHRRSEAQDDLEGVSHVSIDHGFFGEKEFEEQVTLVLVIWETETHDDVGYVGAEKGNGVHLDHKESSEVHRPAWTQRSHAQVRQRAGG